MSFEPLDYLHHIIVETDFLIRESAGLSFEAFQSNETLRRAFVRSLEVIGQAAKNVPEEFRAKHAHVRWRAIAGMRDRLIHAYFGVDYEIVWDVVRNRVPELQLQLRRILDA
jgi:uncharacterized protein with HEPN domain